MGIRNTVCMGAGLVLAAVAWGQDQAVQDQAVQDQAVQDQEVEQSVPINTGPIEPAQEITQSFEGPFVDGFDQACAAFEDGRGLEAVALARRLAQENKASLRRRSWQATTRGLSERLFFRESSPLAGWVDPGRSRVQQSAARNLEGLAHHKRGALEAAEEAWQVARGLAIGRGSLAACDGLGLLDLELAEEYFAQIPEVQGKTNNPMAPNFTAPAPSTQGTDEEEAPDPLSLARESYLAAREHLVERLRVNWRNEDTRANVELIQKRLHSLDDIEAERRQEDGQERSDDQSQDSEAEDSNDSSDEGSENPEDEPQESDQQKESEGDPEGEGDPQENEEDSDDPEEQPEEGDGEEQAEPEERLLTKEEQQRLLDQLRRHNEKGEELRERLARLRARSTDKDW
jgi:hypothetical protein